MAQAYVGGINYHAFTKLQMIHDLKVFTVAQHNYSNSMQRNITMKTCYKNFIHITNSNNHANVKCVPLLTPFKLKKKDAVCSSLKCILQTVHIHFVEKNIIIYL
jgi:hypothetical protein